MTGTTIKIKGTGSAVYFLKRNNKVIYVGQSKRVMSRLSAHANKKYDEITILWCATKNLLPFERRMIKKYDPKFNGHCENPDGTIRVRISPQCESLLASYISSAKLLFNGYNVSPVKVVNSMLVEKLRQEVKRFGKSDTNKSVCFRLDINSDEIDQIRIFSSHRSAKTYADKHRGKKIEWRDHPSEEGVEVSNHMIKGVSDCSYQIVPCEIDPVINK